MTFFTLDSIPRFSPRLRPLFTEETLYLLGENERYVLSGERTLALARLIDGRRSVEEIVSALSGLMPEPVTLYTLHRLQKSGYLCQAVPRLSEEKAILLDGLGLFPPAHPHENAPTAVTVATVSGMDASEMVSALKNLGILCEGPPSLIVAITEDLLNPELRDIAKKAKALGIPWLPVQPMGLTPGFGPWFPADSGPCLACVAHGVKSNRPVESCLARHLNTDIPPASSLRSVQAGGGIVVRMAALEVLKIIENPDAWKETSRALVTLNLNTLETSRHPVMKRPQCPSCGTPSLMGKTGRRPITLASIPRPFTEDGGYRRESPSKTVETYQHLISPVTGPVSYLTPMPGRNTDLRAVFASGYLVSPRGDLPTTNLFDKGCAGKGRAPGQAKASALCEALERYSGVWQGDEATVVGSKTELGDEALHLNAIQNFSSFQFENRHTLNAAISDKRRWIPEPFDVSVPIHWTPGWSLTHNERRYLPLSYTFAETPPESGSRFGTHNPNGAAAGTCLEEAILQGALELVERDATAIWWYHRIQRPAVDLHSFDEPYFGQLTVDYARQGWTLHVLDLTHDLSIPTCAAVAYHPESHRFSIGFGCHMDLRLAVQRALTEINQLFDPTGSRQAPWEMKNFLDTAFLFPDPTLPTTRSEATPILDAGDLKTDVEGLVKTMAGAGLETIVVDKTRPDIGLTVVQVIIPGLRHFWPRFGKGRLYSVPEKMGWMDRTPTEKELNPTPLFL